MQGIFMRQMHYMQFSALLSTDQKSISTPPPPPPKTIMQQLNFLWSSSQVKKPMFKQAVPQEQGYQGSYCFKTPSTP